MIKPWGSARSYFRTFYVDNLLKTVDKLLKLGKSALFVPHNVTFHTPISGGS